MRSFFPRLFAIALAVLGLAWAVRMLPVFWQSRGLERTADLIVQGHRFDAADLVAESAKIDERGLSPYVTVRRSLAFLKLRLVEQALATGDRQSLDGRLADLKRSTINLLEIEPSDSFFWMIYYWSNVLTDGFAPSQLKFLEFSYEVGPDEGWIASRRNRLALAVFSQLPPAMAEQVLSEFAGMVASGLIEDAAASLMGPGAPIRTQLLQRLSDVPIAERERLARYLQGNGVELEVPGVNLPQKRFY